MKKSNDDQIKKTLRETGYRATPGKVDILRVLLGANQHLTITEISEGLKSNLNQTTLYRTIHSFVEKKLVRAINFNDSVVRYESMTGSHHHHVICTKCNHIENVDICKTGLEDLALAKSRSFRIINDHAVELFGTCNNCLKKD